jgi:hypothetical protein
VFRVGFRGALRHDGRAFGKFRESLLYDADGALHVHKSTNRFSVE